ncbi:MAG: VWA domain-containing protein [Kofleriaceae bacterium]|nr:VWA domain-containing protein [Kofleriaceae bacterium]
MTKSHDHDVLEQNVSTLLESGGEPPRISGAARTRIREELVAKHGVVAHAKARVRVPLFAVGIGLAATAATALVVAKLVGDEPARDGSHALADGSTFITEPGAKVTVLGTRRVRVEGAALLDVAPGKGTFVVETARGRIEVLGTRFLVDAEADRTTAAVVRGQVKLATDQGAVTLHAGEQAVAEPGRPPTRGPAPRLSHLVSWAQEARHREERDMEPIRHGTLFARDPGMRPNGQFGEEYPLPLKQLTVDVVVDDQVARVALDQTFHNATNRTLEGVYRFAIPSDAALQRLAMYVDGKLTESAVVERMQGRRIYEELVYRRIDPALLEYAGTGRLNLRVYPLVAQQDKRLMVAYTQSLPKLYSDWTLAIPLPEVDQPVGDMVVSARIKGCANCELTSTSHQIAVERAGEDAIVRYHRSADKIGDTFVVHVRDSRKQATVATHVEGSDTYMLVRAPADLGGKAREYRPRTWVILDDVSASRSQLELRAQADLVDAFLRELDEDDKVGVVAFDVQARTKLAPTRVIDVDRRTVRAALKEEGGVGATDFDQALDAAMKMLAGVNPDDAMIVYLGDGVITSGARNLDALRARIAGKAHFVGVGVGDGPDTQTLDGLAAATGGYSTTIDLADDVGWRAFDLVAALHTNRVTGVSARLVDAQGNLVPSTTYLRSPQLADGEELELVSRLAGAGTPAAIELTGTRDGAAWTQRISLDGKAGGDAGYLPRLWASRHIAARLLAKHEPVVVPPCTDAVATHRQAAVTCPTEAQLREQRDEEIRKEVVMLGKQYFLLSRHTSLLVLENDAMYAKYGVRKGSGDTWAPYAMPEKIAAVAPPPGQAVPADVADDAELVRAPLQVFYSYGGYDSWSNDEAAGGFGLGWSGPATGAFGTIGHGSGTGQGFGVGHSHTGRGRSGGEVADRSRRALGLVNREPTTPDAVVAATESQPRFVEKKAAIDLPKAKPAGPRPVTTRSTISASQISGGFIGDLDLRRANMHRRPARYYGYYNDNLTPARFTYPSDPAFDDLTGLVPALVPDAADVWRAELADSEADYPIDPAAAKLLGEARTRLPSGIYRWAGLEIAVDGAHRFAWKRTTDVGLGETASFDGTSFVRRYGELGLSVARPIASDDVAMSFAYLPVWIAEPSHYAKYFVVGAQGSRQVTLSKKANGKDVLAYVLTFDDKARLVAVHDGEGVQILAVTWGAVGPASAQLGGDDLSVGFTAESIADASLWAHGATPAGVTVELPAHLPAFWRAQLAKEQPGSAGWRRAQRQLMVALAAINDRGGLYEAYAALHENGGVERGDLVLASAGIATATTDKQFADALAPLAKEPVARYLLAGRAYRNSPKPARLEPGGKDGVLGPLWSLRSITAQLGADQPKKAVDELLAMGDRAYTLRLLATTLVSQRWNLDAKDIVRAWDSVATGEYKNIALGQAAQVLYSRGQYDLAADRIMKLAAELDLDAKPARLEIGQYAFNASRRGPVGWHIAYSTWRDRVLAGTSFAHVMALARTASSHPGDVSRVLARAVELAGSDVDRKLAVVGLAMQLGQPAIARSIIEPMLKASPTRDVLQYAAQQAVAENRTADALALYERAQDAGADEQVDVSTVRSELSQIIGLARQVAIQSTGAARDKAITTAMTWATRWRLIDPGNIDIDRQVGELLLAVGDSAGAWRQLSSTIERDPWSSAGYTTVADTFEREGRVTDALDMWQQAIVIDQTNPTPRLRKAQALIALGRTAEGDALLAQIASGKWHEIWSSTVYQAKNLLERGKQAKTAP